MKQGFGLSMFLALFFAAAGTAHAGDIATVTGDIPTEFGTYHPYPVLATPSSAPYQVTDAFLDSLGFDGREKELLRANGFFVGPPSYARKYDGGGYFKQYATIPEMYKNYREEGIPVFVTTDAVLHSFHELYDYALKEVELTRLAGDLNRLCRTLASESEKMFATASKDSVKEAIRKNTAYLAVGAKLGDPTFTPPEGVSGLVGAELALIAAHEGFDFSPIFRFPEGAVPFVYDYLEDYSQYVPRGHYADNDTLSTYFLSAMWLGRMAFRTKPPGGEEEVYRNKGIEETFMAILVVKTVLETAVDGRPALEVWRDLYDPAVFFVGRSDDLTIEEYRDTMDKVYGTYWLDLSPDDLYDREKILAFIEEVNKLRDPRINSSWVWWETEDVASATKSFRFLGQRFIPDSYMFSELVYSKVGTFVDPRLLPMSLDVMAVLGSERAFEHLTTMYKQDRYFHYLDQMDSLRTEFSALLPETWVQNLYWSWLYSLLPLLEAKGAGYPPFMQNEAWTDKQLAAALGSWTELRHDSILYAKQSYTGVGIGEEPVPPIPWLRQGYVEPNPELYGRLASLAGLMEEGLSARDMLSEAVGGRLSILERLLLDLKSISEKELTDVPLTSSEYETINNIGPALESIQPPAPIEDTFDSHYTRNMALVADVHTDPNFFNVLEEGVGHASELFVIVRVAGRLKLARGAVFTGYEFVWPMRDRLTDAAWRDLLDGEQPPVLPEWVGSFRDRDDIPVSGGWDVKNHGLLAPKVAVSTNTPSHGDEVEITFRVETPLTEPPTIIVTSQEGEHVTAKMDTIPSGEGGYRCVLPVTGGVGEARVTIEASYLSGWNPSGPQFLSTLEYDIPIWIQSSEDAVGENRPLSFALFPVYPNPFNGETEVAFELPVKGLISIVVYDVLGRRVRTVFSGVREAGRHSESINMEDAATGLYFISLKAPQGRLTRKMLFLR